MREVRTCTIRRGNLQNEAKVSGHLHYKRYDHLVISITAYVTCGKCGDHAPSLLKQRHSIVFERKQKFRCSPNTLIRYGKLMVKFA